MVVDSSALVCILLGEPDAATFSRILAEAPVCCITAVNWLETVQVATARLGIKARDELDQLLATVQAEVVSVDRMLAAVAYRGWLAYGKGRHPAGLNFGDCFSYALAKQRSEPLLFKGEDFSKTDIVSSFPSRSGASPR